MQISAILDKVDEKQLFVPAFQREYVWKRDDAKQLLDSLVKEYPTGTMLLWETANPPELKGPHKYDRNRERFASCWTDSSVSRRSTCSSEARCRRTTPPRKS